MRLAAVFLLGGARRREIAQLFARTAAAFGCPLPCPQARGAKGLLAEYALFTREQAEAALDSGKDLQALERRLFRAALAVGIDYRRRLRVRSFSDAMAAARLIYRGLGIDFRGRSGRGGGGSPLRLRGGVHIPGLRPRLGPGPGAGGSTDRGWKARVPAPSHRRCPGLSGSHERRNAMTAAKGDAPRAIVVGSGAGGAAAARELQRSCRVTVLEAGREFRPRPLCRLSSSGYRRRTGG